MTDQARISDDTRWRSVQAALARERDRADDEPPVEPCPAAEPLPGRTCRR